MKKLTRYFAALATFAAPGLLFAEEAQAAAAQGRSPWSMFLIVGAGLVLFYLIILRPEQKRRKKMAKTRSSLKKGDRITAMGIVGTVDKIEEESVILKLDDGAKMEILKAAISDVTAAAASGAEITSHSQVEPVKS